DILMGNDSEARELSGDWNVHRAGRWILAHGPKRVVVEQGEHGAMVTEPGRASGPFVGAGPPLLRACVSPGGSIRSHRRGRCVRGRVHGISGSDRLGFRGEHALRYGLRCGHGFVCGFAFRRSRVRGSHLDRRAAARTDLSGPYPRCAGRAGAVSDKAGERAGGQYLAAGVDLVAAETAKERIGQLVGATRTSLSVGRIGAFGGMIRVPSDIANPVLVLSTDGVGTKVLVALEAGRFDTVGEDLVNHSVNDILVHGATPIAFMDSIAGP